MNTNQKGGWAFPLTFELDQSQYDGADASSIKLIDGDEGIRQSICTLLHTQPGERIMRPAYGCDLESAMFANMDDGLVAHVTALIHESITSFEPRAQALQIVVDSDSAREGHLRVTIAYKHVETGRAEQIRGVLHLTDGTRGSFQ